MSNKKDYNDNTIIEFDTHLKVLKEVLNQTNTKFKKGIIIFIFFIISIGIMLLIRTIEENTKNIASSTPVSNELRDQLFEEKERNDRLSDSVKEKEKTLTKVREEATKNNSKANSQREKVDKNNKVLGLTQVKGEGVQIILRDGELKEGNLIDPTQVIVHYNDILQVINMLRNAGAEAISVNGHRIVANTPISCIGTVILINNQKVGGPYNILAVGDKNKLESAINIPGGLLTVIEKYGVKVSKEKKDEITIEAYNGVYNFQYINEAILNNKKNI